jgi:hypothetical protein
MADFFRGLTGGFQSGLQLGQQLRQRRMEDELAQAYAKPETSQGYTAEDGQRLEELAKTGAYDIVPQYAPAAEGQTQGVFTGYQAVPKAGLDLQGDMPAAPMAFNPQQVQDYGGRRVAGQFNPTELRGLQMQEAARVLGSYGDVRGAAALQAQAEEQAYQAKYRPLQLQQLQGSIAGQEQQRELTGIQLGSAKRTEAELQRASEFSNFAAENPNLTTAELKDAAFKQFKFTPKQWQEAVNTRLGISENEQKLFMSGVKDKLKGKNLQQLGALYNSDPDFDDKTDLAIVPGKNGAVTLNFIDKATNKITGTQTFKSESLATEYLNKQATEPETIGTWMVNLRKAEAAIDESTAGAGLKRAQTANVGQEKLSPLEKNLNTLKRLNIPVTDAQIKTMVFGAQKDPALEAELAAITKIAGSDTANPKVLEALPGQIQAALARSKGRETATAVVAGLTKAQEAGKGEEAIAELRKKGMAEPSIQAAAAQAGVTYTAPPVTATQPQTQAQPTRGLMSGAQPAAYVPPADSRAGRALAAQTAQTETAAETNRAQATARAQLSSQFAADARTLTPLELIRKYDAVRAQLPTADKIQLQQAERYIR